MEKIKSKGWKFTNPKTKEVDYIPDWIAKKLQKNREEEKKQLLKIVERYCQFRINGCKYDIQCGYNETFAKGMIEAYDELRRKLVGGDTIYCEVDIVKHHKYWTDEEYNECAKLVRKDAFPTLD